MKKLFLIILIIIVAIVYFEFKDSGPSPENFVSSEAVDSNFRPDPSSATFIFDEGPITLSQGKYSRNLAPNTAIQEEILLTNIRGYGDINTDNKNDSVVILVQSGGASGVFIYLAGYISGPITYKGTNAIFIGDRITPQSISINEGVINLSYLDREPGEAFAEEPTTPANKQFIYRNGILEER